MVMMSLEGDFVILCIQGSLLLPPKALPGKRAGREEGCERGEFFCVVIVCLFCADGVRFPGYGLEIFSGRQLGHQLVRVVTRVKFVAVMVRDGTVACFGHGVSARRFSSTQVRPGLEYVFVSPAQIEIFTFRPTDNHPLYPQSHTVCVAQRNLRESKNTNTPAQRTYVQDPEHPNSSDPKSPPSRVPNTILRSMAVNCQPRAY